MKRETQIHYVSRLLSEGKTITPIEAFKNNITRLSSIIYELRYRHGMPIETRTKTSNNGSRYAEYYLPVFEN